MPDIDESKDSKQCRLAFKAALDTVNKYCGGGSQLKVQLTPGNFIEVPLDVVALKTESKDTTIGNIKRSQWAEEAARGLCYDVLGIRTERTLKQCIDRTKEKLAERVWDEMV